MEEIIINKIEWSAPEYKHEVKSMDFIWGIGLLALIVCGISLWMSNYLFAMFVFIAGATLIFFSIRHPEYVTYSIETSGLSMGKDKYPWKQIKGFHIKKETAYTVLLIETTKYFLPIYTIPLPEERSQEVREELSKIIPNIELEESKSMLFMEKIGF